jgi:hypothetical protein
VARDSARPGEGAVGVRGPGAARSGASAPGRGAGAGQGQRSREGCDPAGERGGWVGEGGSPWDPNSGDNRPPDHLGQRGGREVEEREREVAARETKMRERGRGHAWVGCGAPGACG